MEVLRYKLEAFLSFNNINIQKISFFVSSFMRHHLQFTSEGRITLLQVYDKVRVLIITYMVRHSQSYLGCSRLAIGLASMEKKRNSLCSLEI